MHRIVDIAQKRTEEAFGPRPVNSTHYEGCWHNHPACAYLMATAEVLGEVQPVVEAIWDLLEELALSDILQNPTEIKVKAGALQSAAAPLSGIRRNVVEGQ